MIEFCRVCCQSHSVSVEMVKMCDGCEIEVDEAIDTAEKQDGWVIIEDLHLAPTTFYKELKRRLLRLYRSRGEEDDECSCGTYEIIKDFKYKYFIPPFVILIPPNLGSVHIIL